LEANVDVAECDREPIHIPGAIQPHGILLVVPSGGGAIVSAAGDFAALLGFRRDPVGVPLEDVVGTSLAGLTRESGFMPGEEPLFLGTLATPFSPRQLDVLAHERDGLVLIELEPAVADRPSAARTLASLRAAMVRISAQSRLEEACRIAAAEVRAFTGYDRALVYRFLEDGAGRVIAEDGNGALPSLLDQHFPASDIPAQARALYRRNLIRVIPDVTYVPAPLRGGDGEPPLDMSDCALRSVSPVHLQYLRNMAVASSMSVSIMDGETLWGMIACHSTRPTLVPYETRESCKQISTTLAQQTETIAARRQAQESARLAGAREQVLAKLAGSDAVEAEAARLIDELQRLIPCDGIAVCYDGRATRAGATPSEEECAALAGWARRKDATPPFATSNLSAEYDVPLSHPASAAGLLAVTAGREDPLELLWLRSERAETIEWAGHPQQSATGKRGELNPRASFEAWRETVRGKARPWTAAEIEAAQRVREGLERIKERQSISRLQASLIHVSRVNAMGAMASSIAHEINQPLMAVTNYTKAAARMLAQRGESDEEIATALRSASEQALRAGEILRHMRQLVSASGSKPDRSTLASIVDGAFAIALLDAGRMGVEVSVDLDRGLEVFADRIQIQQVLLNLIRNALEAMAVVSERRLLIAADLSVPRFVQISVADSGPGVAEALEHRLFSAFTSEKEDGLGIGLSICRTIIEAHGGRIRFSRRPEGGARFSFTLPRVESKG
jgi:light-regulated signal transduction histidine kinase (bacteriophytochrome)